MGAHLGWHMLHGSGRAGVVVGNAAGPQREEWRCVVATVASILALVIMQAIGHRAWHPPHIVPIAFMFVVLYGSLALRRVP